MGGLPRNQHYSTIDCYIDLAQEHLNQNGNSSATATLEKLLRVIHESRCPSLSIDQRIEYVNVINSGVSLLNIMMSVE